ncbi:MAG: nitrilase-related carbon-nitrogen hydrolase [Candidatus Korarchaeota archaeon]|nr:nitrilase-related carbon-nitrogen hydrolase [Candidatus Korarchaeota archaeon]
MKRVGFVQNDPLFGEVERNVARALELASKVEADLLVFPELFNTGYLFLSKEEVSKLAEDLEGHTVSELREFAEETSTALVAGFAERDGDKFYNSAVVIDEKGDVRGVYRKTHLFFEEKLFFEPGDTGFQVFHVAGMRVGVMICYDWRFPEAARTLALKGAQVIAHPSNLVLPFAPTVDLARAVENRVYIILSDRSGVEERGGKRFEYEGRSLIVDPSMKVLVQAPKEGEHVMVAEIDPKLADSKKINELNDIFGDRRPEFYEGLC